MYIYNADTYCDSCGAAIAQQLEREAAAGRPIALPDDSDHYPQRAAEEATDSPDHCAAAGECLEPVELADWGLAPDAPLYGAESRTIGALLSDGLTEHGREYLQFLLERERTPYQAALHGYWKEVFADELS